MGNLTITKYGNKENEKGGIVEVTHNVPQHDG